MKRTCLVIAILICFCISCFAEETTEQQIYELRNGISFGDTREDVLKKETIPVLFTANPSYLYYSATKIEGLKDSHTYYFFDDDSKLTEVMYSFSKDETSNAKTVSYYDKIERNLTERYGEPLSYKNGQHHRIVGEAITMAIDSFEDYKKYNGTGSMIRYTERVVDFGTYSVKVDHSIYWLKLGARSETYYYHDLSFCYFDDSTPDTEGNINITVKPTATPIPSVSLPFEIASVSIKKNSIGTPELFVVFRNTGKKSIDRIDFAVECYDVYGNIVKGYGYYDYTTCYFESGIIGPGRSTPTDHRWTLYGFDGTRNVKIAITRYHLTDGTSVTIPENRWVWKKY